VVDSALNRRIGKIIKKSRTALGISQEKFGEILGVSFQQVQKYESGINNLNPERLQQVANALGIPITVFFGESENTKESKWSKKTVLNDEEIELLKYFRKLRKPTEKSLGISFLKQLAKHFSHLR